MFGQKSRQIEALQHELKQLRQQFSACDQERIRQHQRADWYESFFNEHGGVDVWNREQETEKVQLAYTATMQNLERAEALQSNLNSQVDDLKAERTLLEAGLERTPHPAEDSIALQSQLRTLRQDISSRVKQGTAVSGADDFEAPKTATQTKRIARGIAKLALRAFNAEADNAIRHATAANFDTSAAKIFRSATAIEKLASTAQIRIDPDYIELRVRELRLAVEHLEAKKIERELERERRQELREIAVAEREMEAARKRIQKEKQHYLNVLKTVEKLGNDEEAERLKAEVVSLDKSLNEIEHREANVRAGYVYVISNIGSFGENMVKIGLTRRLEPMDRVKELSDASVPFNFDVHAMFFSEDAVGVETALHQRFADRKANLVNTRREFFLVTPGEVKEALLEIEGTLLEFHDVPEADQWRQTIALREANTPET